MTDHERHGDFAAGERTQSESSGAPRDFAEGEERERPGAPRDFAEGEERERPGPPRDFGEGNERQRPERGGAAPPTPHGISEPEDPAGRESS